MADTIRDMITSQLNPIQGWDLLRYLAPALVSALDANLPLDARSYNLEEIEVAGDTSGALDYAGEILKVNVTAGGATGVFDIVTAAPNAGECQVTYSSSTGIATLTFNAADAVTEAKVVMNKLPPDYVERMAEGAWC
jgi:hypothetical protein